MSATTRKINASRNDGSPDNTRTSHSVDLGLTINKSEAWRTDRSRPELDLDYLDSVPRLERGTGRAAAGSVFEFSPSGVAAEQFRLMQRRLTTVHPRGSSVLLTSPGSGDGKSVSTFNLAWALAEAGHKTILLELDLRRPTQSHYIRAQLPATMGDVLSGKVSAAAAVRRVAEVPLFYIGLQKAAAEPTELLRSKELDDLLAWARRNFSWIVIDGPPVLAVSDVEELLPKIDLVLMVARERVTPRLMLERAAERLGERLNFVIFNDVSLTSTYGY